jgi:hypothetical protein
MHNEVNIVDFRPKPPNTVEVIFRYKRSATADFIDRNLKSLRGSIDETAQSKGWGRDIQVAVDHGPFPF